MNEKTTVYIEPTLKKDIQVELLTNHDNKSLSKLINELLEQWLKKQKR